MVPSSTWNVHNLESPFYTLLVDIFINMCSFNLQSSPERRSSGFEVVGQKWWRIGRFVSWTNGSQQTAHEVANAAVQPWHPCFRLSSRLQMPAFKTLPCLHATIATARSISLFYNWTVNGWFGPNLVGITKQTSFDKLRNILSSDLWLPFRE